jgi:hypothetical protein
VDRFHQVHGKPSGQTTGLASGAIVSATGVPKRRQQGEQTIALGERADIARNNREHLIPVRQGQGSGPGLQNVARSTQLQCQPEQDSLTLARMAKAS